MRKYIWNLVISGLPVGVILPWWALIIRVILFPLDHFFWYMSETRGYQPRSDVWLIDGVTYSDRTMRLLADAQGETYRITRIGKIVTFEKIHANNKDIYDA